MTRLEWIDQEREIAVVRQCELVGVSRSVIYAHRHPVLVVDSDLTWTPPVCNSF
jgi:hypothetical protein